MVDEIEVGRIYGFWKVLGTCPKPDGIKGRTKYFMCQCQCEAKTTRPVRERSLREGTSRCCGCFGNNGHTGKDEVGKTFGKWKVITRVEKPPERKSRGKYFLCECGCPEKTQRVFAGNVLRRGVTHCGCEDTGIRNPDAPFNALHNVYRINAKKRKKPFELTVEDIKNLTQAPCRYCGSPPSTPMNYMPNHCFVYNGIDRLDNALGYCLSNCVPCCKVCNTAKLTMSLDEFKTWITTVYQRLCA